MEKPLSVLLADSSEEFLTLLSDRVELEEDLYILGAARDGEELVSLVRRLRPDVLVTDVLLRNLDGIAALRRLKEEGEMPQTIVVSAFFNDHVAAEISKLGVCYCFTKPCRISELLDRIRECGDGLEREAPPEGGYEAAISEALMNANVLPHLQGYRYLREGVRRTLEDPGVLHGITKILYPDLARHFHTNAKCVEHSMRNALEIAWKEGDAKRRADYFGPGFAQLKRRPTNSEFLALVSEFILLKQQKENRSDVG